MDRAIPTTKKVLFQKWKETEMRIHKDKLKHVEPGVEKVRGIKMIRIRSNKNFREECKSHIAKLLEIERQNQLLLKKMTHIMSTSSFSYFPPVNKSLNQGSRKKDLLKITMENIKMGKRIRQQRSQYNVKLWEKEREKEKNLLGIICEYPYQLTNSKSQKLLPRIISSNSSSGLVESISGEKIVHQQLFKAESGKYLVDIYAKRK
jgi:hypothetical protein